MQSSGQAFEIDEGNGFPARDKGLNIQEQCSEFGRILGLSQPVPSKVLFAALEDGTYAHNLLTCRRSPEFMDHLLQDPPDSTLNKGMNDSKLASRLEKALLRWSQTGFSLVDDDTLKRREDACLSCHYLIDPVKREGGIDSPEKAALRIGERTGSKMCQICGCSVSGKMRRSSASCPSKHPGMEGMTRWGEPVQEKT